MIAAHPKEVIRTEVEDYLKKSNALEKWWQRPVTADQLQAEMDRMVKSSRAPQVLQELFDALGGDPFLIAETLARQTLVERLIRSWYAFDGRFHGGPKHRAETARAACASADCMKSMGGEYRETRWTLDGEDLSGAVEEVAADGAVRVGAEEWKSLIDRLTATHEGSANLPPREGSRTFSSRSAPPTKQLSEIRETSDGFAVTSILSKGEREITTATVAWPKQPFESWWASESAALGRLVAPHAGSFTLPTALLTGCVNDTWSPMPPQVLDARYGHSFVWTGSEMIVWGGYSTGPILGTGLRYTPATDTWTQTSMGMNVPSRRVQHTAVWTGSEMIVWGGNNSVELNTGGRYSPSTDSWTATSTGTNVPAVRSYHTAVWTGSEMIVWGGLGSTALNTGGRYCACTIVPAEVDTGLRITRSGAAAVITWNPAANATTSDVLRGLVSGLPVGPGGGDEACLASAIPGTTLTDSDPPAMGDAFWYLVRGRNDCGKGPYGSAAQNGVPTTPRVSTTCP